MVIRDLTLRSAASFGSFHLIRLLYDEYMFYIVEHKVAEATHTTPIAVIGLRGSPEREIVSIPYFDNVRVRGFILNFNILGLGLSFYDT